MGKQYKNIKEVTEEIINSPGEGKFIIPGSTLRELIKILKSNFLTLILKS